MADAVLVYDDDCGFCTWWADFFDERSDLRIVGFSEVDQGHRARLPEHYEQCSHLVAEEGIYSCGASIEEAFVRSTVGSFARPAVDALRRANTYEALREWGYRRVAHNRPFWGQIVSKTPPAREKRRDEAR